MNISAALKQEEAKWEKQVSAAQQQLDKVRAAIKLLGGTGRFTRSGLTFADANISPEPVSSTHF